MMRSKKKYKFNVITSYSQQEIELAYEFVRVVSVTITCILTEEQCFCS